jgi:prophage regulatory protein
MSKLPETGFLRLPQIIGRPGVSEEEARENRLAGKGPKRSCKPIVGLVPFGKSTLWSAVKSGHFPAPIKLGARLTAWRVEEIRAWLENPITGRPDLAK